MKRLFQFTVLLVLASVGTSYGQWYLNTLDSAVQDSVFILIGTGITNQVPTDSRAFMNRTDDPTNKHEGVGAMKCDWSVYTPESWGGYLQLMHLKPRDSVYYDWGHASQISLWYDNTVAANGGLANVQMRFKIHEAGGAADYWGNGDDHEDWYYQTSAIYDNTPGWKQLVISLSEIPGADGSAPNDQGFSLPGWSGIRNNGKLDYDKIVGYSIEWTSVQLSGSNLTAQGSVTYDQIQLLGTKYPPVETFDGVAGVGGYYNIDNMSWSAGNTGYIHLSDMTTEPFEGTSSLQCDYRVEATEGWGGYANFEHKFTTPLDLSQRSYLVAFVKNVIPDALFDASNKPRLTCRFILYDDSGTTTEPWFTLFDIPIDSATQWRKIKMPLVGLGTDWNLTTAGFKNPPGQGDGNDDIFTTAKIGGYKIEFSVNANGPTGAGVISQGTILFDLVTPAGFQETDKTPPDPVTGVTGTPSTFTNLITWNDVPTEPNTTKYNVYYSETPFTTLDDPGVEDIPFYGIATGTQLQTHILRAPGTDQSVSYYYGVTATDAAINTNQPTVTSSPITNMAKGVPTIATAPPAAFAVDGDLTEWASIPPFDLAISKGTAYVNPNGRIDGDNDCSVLAYLAMDQTNLYVAFDITDDIVEVDTAGSAWQQDCPDLFIGLYDWRGRRHTGYRRGATPDYHFRFSQNRAYEDKLSREILRPGVDYVWQKKGLFPGYTVEAKISWDFLKSIFPEDTLFVPQVGMRIPIDFEINDRDAKTASDFRDGMLIYSPYNEDLSYQDMWRWTHTWIGNQWVTDVRKEQGVPEEFSLSQNYPNPFNPSTEIRYSIAKPGFTTVRIYDVLGREIATLVNEYQQTGTYTVTFNTATAGAGLSSGAYFYKIESGTFRAIKKMMLLK